MLILYKNRKKLRLIKRVSNMLYKFTYKVFTQKKKDNANCISYSQAVTHPSTNGTRRSLTSGS
jgi:hypothetical protein